MEHGTPALSGTEQLAHALLVTQAAQAHPQGGGPAGQGAAAPTSGKVVVREHHVGGLLGHLSACMGCEDVWATLSAALPEVHRREATKAPLRRQPRKQHACFRMHTQP